ncbi:hypothetical protein J2X69_003236 [Algoriphagus sp. 4150]|nr:hypothetical protein [Algoriphagus sp. 4150]
MTQSKRYENTADEGGDANTPWHTFSLMVKK